jgi:hypothetical protein
MLIPNLKLIVKKIGSTFIGVLATVMLAGCNKEPETVKVTAIWIEPTEKILLLDEKFTPEVSAFTENADNTALTWKSDKPTVATVNSPLGEVTAIGAGEAVITAATTVDGRSDGMVRQQLHTGGSGSETGGELRTVIHNEKLDHRR